jgi:hypothetical protein
VASALPGVVDELEHGLGEALETVALPPMIGIDTPDPRGLPAYTGRLEQAVRRGLRAGPVEPLALDAFTWRAVFGRIEGLWDRIAGRHG